jgi:UDP-2-acetamido-3-amino-2,3-dideoxy-glucuronate N-acetyltransferase
MAKKNPSPVTPIQSTKPESPSVAVIGGGYWGKNLIRNYYNLDALKLVADKSETLLSNLRDQYNGVDTCLAIADVLARDDIDGVVISTPAETHFNIARECLLAGKHV